VSVHSRIKRKTKNCSKGGKDRGKVFLAWKEAQKLTVSEFKLVGRGMGVSKEETTPAPRVYLLVEGPWGGKKEPPKKSGGEGWGEKKNSKGGGIHSPRFETHVRGGDRGKKAGSGW